MNLIYYIFCEYFDLGMQKLLNQYLSPQRQLLLSIDLCCDEDGIIKRETKIENGNAFLLEPII